MNDFYADYPGAEAEESQFVGADLSRLSQLLGARIKLREAEKILANLDTFESKKMMLVHLVGFQHILLDEEGDCL